jgi:hypothetical protein
MDMDPQEAHEDVDGEHVPLMKSVLVGEADLDGTSEFRHDIVLRKVLKPYYTGITSQFKRILSVYVYSLSPSTIRVCFSCLRIMFIVHFILGCEHNLCSHRESTTDG